MAKSDNANTRDPVKKVLAQFDAREDTLKELCSRTKSLIEDCLQDAQLRHQPIQFRVKKRDKLRAKYVDSRKDYRRLDDITDQAALRVITYYDDEVDRVAEVIKKEFAVIPEKSIDKRETEPDRFGYYALNFVCTHTDKRKADVQFKKYAGFCFEIQVTSILRHAWSEIEHEWYDLKDAYPDEIKRRFYRLAALLEIAESEFLDLRKLKTDYRRSVDVQVEAEVSDVPVNAVSLKAFISREPIVARIDERISSILGVPLSEPTDRSLEDRSAISNMAGLSALQLLAGSLRKYEAPVLEYVRRCNPHWQAGRSQSLEMPKGVCIFHLAMMLLALEGEDRVHHAMESLGIRRVGTLDDSTRVAIARKVLAEYPN